MRPVDAEHGVGAPGEHGRKEVIPDVDRLHVGDAGPICLEHRIEKCLVTGHSRYGHAHASQVAGTLDGGIGEHHQRVERMLDEGRDGDNRDVLRAGVQHFGVIRDAEGVPTGANRLQHGRRVGRGVDLDIEPGLGEVAPVERHEDPGVVGVRVPVQGKGDGRWFLGVGECAGPEPAKGEPGGSRGGGSDNRPARDRSRRERRSMRMRRHGKQSSDSCAGITPVRFDGRWSIEPPSQPGPSELPFRVVAISLPDVAGAEEWWDRRCGT